MTKRVPLDFKPSTPEELAMCLADPWWRLCSGNLYKILVKVEGDDGLSMPFKPNRAQRRLLKSLHTRNLILKARQLGFCLDPSTRVLTADLRWVPIGELKPGQEVVACDEMVPGGRGSSRKLRTATVQAAAKVHRKAYRITFDDGRSVVCTAQHPWLSRKAGTQAEWRSLDGTGNKVVGRLKVGTKVRWVAKPWEEPGYEDGWMGGMLDGEGSIAKRNASAGINVSQLVGPALARMEMYLHQRGYNYRTENDAAERDTKHGSTPVPKLCIGRMDEMFRLIGQTRPIRFIGNRFWEGRELPGKKTGIGWATITSIEELGEQTMIDLQTSTGTYIAEGFVSHNTTLIAIFFLDCCLFRANVRAGIIAQDLGAVETIFRDKIKHAYDNLPEQLRLAMPLEVETKRELVFAHNNSGVRVGTSMRSGTLQYLHISEMGKIAKKWPEKAREIVTGSIPAVPSDGMVFIESTAEGAEGEFYIMAMRAKALADRGKQLALKEFRFLFFPWWGEMTYRADPDLVTISSDEDEYFDKIEAAMGCTIDVEQRAWWIGTRDNEFGGADEKMWQEYPSTPEEAFAKSLEGCYYTKQLVAARKTKRITTVPYMPGHPVNTFWDIGSGDGTAIWFHQQIGQQHRFIKFIEGWGEPYAYFVGEMQKLGYVWGTHYLPHDGNHVRQGEIVNATPREMLEKLGLRNIEIVPPVSELQHGITATRDYFAQCWFDEAGCKEGITHLELYRKKWNNTAGCFTDQPQKDIHSEGADSFRQAAQVFKLNESSNGQTRPKRKGSARAV